MKSSMKIFGVGEVMTSFRSLGERVPDAARGQMRRSAEIIVKEAKINTPVDDGFLEKSIRILKSYGYHGRLQIDIVAGGETVFDYDGRDRNLDQYALLVHENYEGAVAYKNGPGPKTLAKMAQYPDHKIGSGFLSRAVEDQEPKLLRAMVAVVANAVKEVMG